jgi:hypothetical protein
MSDQTAKDDDDLDAPVWGAENIGKIVKRTERQVFHLARTKKIDVSKCGKLLVSTPRRLLRSIGVGG